MSIPIFVVISLVQASPCVIQLNLALCVVLLEAPNIACHISPLCVVLLEAPDIAQTHVTSLHFVWYSLKHPTLHRPTSHLSTLCGTP
jgi:hypothetical protein